MSEQSILEEFYKDFAVGKKDKSVLKKELLYQLYKAPKRDKINDTPSTQPTSKNAIHQADILYLPNDDGYKYGLTVVDVGSRLTDCEPLKSK